MAPVPLHLKRGPLSAAPPYRQRRRRRGWSGLEGIAKGVFVINIYTT